MSWHDCAIHGFYITELEHGYGELTLDMDFIFEWIRTESSNLNFCLAPVKLVFHSISSLKVSIDYECVSAAIQPLSIGQIKKENVSLNGSELVKWTIEIDWPSGEIEFYATGFTQAVVGNSVVSKRQFLTKQERES